jgi:hypothetical protein
MHEAASSVHSEIAHLLKMMAKMCSSRIEKRMAGLLI